MTNLSKEEYLKRYLSGDSGSTDLGKKKKKKKKKDETKVAAKVLPRVKIIDDDAYVPSAVDEAAPINLSDDDRENEELPQIAMVQDDRDIEVQVTEEFEKSGKWKTLEGVNRATKNLINEVIKIEQCDIKDEPLSGDEQFSEFLHGSKKKKRHKIKQEIKDEPVSPPRRPRISSDDSPPRRRHDSSDNHSPPRRTRHDSDDSPPRNRRRHDSDQSPPRSRRKSNDSDQSPPRKRKNGENIVKSEPDSDISPPRRRKDEGNDSDISPPRRGRTTNDEDSDLSPPRRNGDAEGGSDSDMSPPRKRRGSDSDISPPRMSKTLDGKKAGLQNAKDLKEELEIIRKKEKRKLEGLSDEVSGRTAETKVRGRLAEKERKEAEEKAKKEVPEAVKEKYNKWNKGVTQVEAAAKKVEDDLHEMKKSFARGVEDEDRERLLMDQEHADDPMLQYMRKKKAKQEGKKRRYPVYMGPQPPPNRFKILPGFRWDGVDRSNGFEAKLMVRDSNKKALEEETYRWNQEMEL